jgi:hypothetical protein
MLGTEKGNLLDEHNVTPFTQRPLTQESTWKFPEMHTLRPKSQRVQTLAGLFERTWVYRTPLVAAAGVPWNRMTPIDDHTGTRPSKTLSYQLDFIIIQYIASTT